MKTVSDVLCMYTREGYSKKILFFMHVHFFLLLHLIVQVACIHVKGCNQHRDLYDFFFLIAESKANFDIWIPVFKDISNHFTHDALFLGNSLLLTLSPHGMQKQSASTQRWEDKILLEIWIN